MGLTITPRELAPRIATGAYILNSGRQKWRADEETAKRLHTVASGTYPVLKNLDPATFVRLLSAAEIGLGAALLVPFVPAALAGAALTAFSGGLLGIYLRTPGMRKPGSLGADSGRPGHLQGRLDVRHRPGSADRRRDPPRTAGITPRRVASGALSSAGTCSSSCRSDR